MAKTLSKLLKLIEFYRKSARTLLKIHTWRLVSDFNVLSILKTNSNPKIHQNSIKSQTQFIQFKSLFLLYAIKHVLQIAMWVKKKEFFQRAKILFRERQQKKRRKKIIFCALADSEQCGKIARRRCREYKKKSDGGVGGC